MGLPTALPFVFSGSTSPGAIVTGRVILLGFSMRESSGAVGAVWDIFDGGSSGPRVFSVTLNVNESTREWFGPMGIAFEQGLAVIRQSGSVVGSVLCLPEERLGEYDYLYTESTG